MQQAARGAYRRSVGADQQVGARHALLLALRRHPIVALAVLVQVTVPAVALVNDPPTRFGFQMYSGVGEVPMIELELAGGSTRDLPLHQVAAVDRVELDWGRRLPSELCQRFPAATHVTLTWQRGGQVDRQECIR